MQNFQNKAEYSAVIFTMWDPISDSSCYNVKLREATRISIVKVGSVLAGGFEAQVLKLYMVNIKMASIRNILKILLKISSNLYI